MQHEERRRTYRAMTHEDGVHPDVAALHLAVQSLDDNLTGMRASIDELSDRISPATLHGVIVGAVKEAAADPDVSRALYQTLTQHARSSFAQYIGERVITALAVLVLSAGIAWWAYTAGAHVK